MSARPRRSKLVSLFGVLGYISCLLQWLWLLILFLPALLDSHAKDLFLPPSGHVDTSPKFELSGPSFLWTGLGIIITLVVLAVTVLILIRLPGSIAKTGHKAVASTAEAALPIVTHHAKLPPKKRRTLTARLIKAAKFIFTLLPILGIAGIYFVSSSLPPDLAFFVGSFLAIGTLVWFSLEYLTAHWLKISPENII